MHEIDLSSLKIPKEIKLKLENIPSISIKRYIDKSSNGYIFFAHHDILNHDRVIKFYSWAGDSRFHKEPQRLKSIESPNVIKIHHAEMVDDEWAFFVTDYCPEGDLDRKIASKRYGVHEGLEITRQILNGLSHLHAANLIHQDIKPGNIFLHSQSKVVIGDFGSVKFIPEGLTTTPSAQSIFYTPPESIIQKKIGTSGDIYQVGIILFQLLGGYFPYEEHAWLDNKQLQLFNNAQDNFERYKIFENTIHRLITKGNLIKINTLPVHVHEDIRKIIRKATHINPGKRYSSCTVFMNELHKSKIQLHDWYIDGEFICLNGHTCYRIKTDKLGNPLIEKRKDGPWRRDNSYTGDLKRIIDNIALRTNKK